MLKVKLTFALSFLLFLSACGGGGGGGSASTAESTQLKASVGNLTGYQLTAGNAADLNGSTTIAFKFSVKTILAKLNGFFISAATAQSISACSSSGLNGTSNQQQWNLIGLSDSKTAPACVSQIQDAGNYLVLQVTGITDSSGSSCDLVTIAKSSGATTCLRLSLPNRASVGSPIFYLDLSNGQSPGQLTLNGKYFFTAFYTKANSSPAYTGFARIDFTGTSPTISVPYASYGVCGGIDCTRLNDQDIFWAPYYPMENGDLMFTQFNLTGNSYVVPNIGIVQTYYVVSNPELPDPTQAVKALVNQTVTTPTDGYSVDMNNSPLGEFVAPLNGGVTQAHYNNDAFSDPAASPTSHSFFMNVNTNASTLSCGTSMMLIRGVVSSAGVLSLTNYGGSNLGNGLGSNALSNDVTPDSSGNLFTLLWQATSSTTYTVTKHTRTLTEGACGTSEVVYTGASTGLNAGHISIQTIRSANTVYMQNFPYWKEAGGSCQLTLGCPLESKIVLGYDLATGVVTPISLAPLNGSQYFVYQEYSASTADRLYFKINDNSTTPPSVVTAQLTPTGFENIIKFKPGVAVLNSVVNGAVPTQ